MDMFNSNSKLEELVMFGLDWGVYLRHDSEEPIVPFLYLQNGQKKYVRMLMTDGDPLEYAKKVLEREEKPYQQFILGFEGYLRNDMNERVDAIVVHGFDVTQEKGVTLGQMFVPKEKGSFTKIDKVNFLGTPELILPLEHTDNPDYSVADIGFNAIAISDKDSGLTKYVTILTHDNASVIANTAKRFLRSKCKGGRANDLSGEFDFQIPDNCVKDEKFLSFLVRNALEEELVEPSSLSWMAQYGRKIRVKAEYNGQVICESTASTAGEAIEKKKAEDDLGNLTIEQLDTWFIKIVNTPGARTDIEALTQMADLLKEYENRGIPTPDKRNAKPTTSSSKEWWQFWK